MRASFEDRTKRFFLYTIKSCFKLYSKKAKGLANQIFYFLIFKFGDPGTKAYEKSMEISQREIENDNQTRGVDGRAARRPVPRPVPEVQGMLWRKERKNAEENIRDLVTILGSMLAIPDQFMSVTEELLIKMTASDGEDLHHSS